MTDQGQSKNSHTDFVNCENLQVAELRTTLFWPLTIDRLPGDAAVLDSKEFLGLVKEWVLADGSPWQSVEDGLRHLPSPQPKTEDPKDAVKQEVDPRNSSLENIAMADAYSEFVYFHDFVQRMLFGKTGGKGAGPLRIFQRTDISTLEVTFFDSCVAFDVERVNLYVLAYGVAVVAVQLSAKPSPALTLKSVLRINDTLRRSHVPYFKAEGERIEPRELPLAVKWKLRDGQEALFSISEEATATENLTESKGEGGEKSHVQPPYVELFNNPCIQDRRVLPVRHWRWLLNGADDVPERLPLKATRKGYRWRHFSDDRFPIMSTVVLEDRDTYYNVSEGNWMRLAFVDPPGDDPYPYAPAFLREGFERHCYDRYHHEQEAKADEPTRYLMCDYAMTAVTYKRGPRPDKNDHTKMKIMDHEFVPTLQMHMQRHYYQIFLLQVIDKAVMLGLSSRITKAVERFGDREHEAELSASLQDIERDFLQYVHRFRFTGVSGQLQPTELHSRLRALMGLDEIFEDIRTELETAVAFLAAREAEHSTEAAERLNIVASLGVVLALVMGFFSMNIVTDKDLLEALNLYVPAVTSPGKTPPVWLHHLLIFSLGLAVISSLSWALTHVIAAWVGRPGSRPRPAEAFVRRSLMLMTVMGTGLAMVLYWIQAVSP